jgi:hypothetical protein
LEEKPACSVCSDLYSFSHSFTLTSRIHER